MDCSFCGKKFDETHAVSSCQGCPMSKGCKMIRCPHCGYEMPPEPKWIGALKKWFGREKRNINEKRIRK